MDKTEVFLFGMWWTVPFFLGDMMFPSFLVFAMTLVVYWLDKYSKESD